MAIFGAFLFGTAASAQESSSNAIEILQSSLDDAASAARASQPDWSSPIATTTGILERRIRFDFADQHIRSGANTQLLDGGKGLDLILNESEEVQFAFAPYDIRSQPGRGTMTGFGDWAFLRFKQRIASSPTIEGDYVLTTWLQIQAPTGIKAFTSGSWTLLPAIAFGKGWGAFDIQATLGGVIPTSNVGTLGHQVQGNVALQYNFAGVVWPELEANWTYYPDGPRAGLNQLFLTPGLTLARFHLSDATTLTTGIGYQVAVAPKYRSSPATPTYRNAILFSSRVNF